MKVGHLIECNTRNIFLEKSYSKYGGELFPDVFLKTQNWAYLQINSLKFYIVSFLLYAKLRAIEILKLSCRKIFLLLYSITLWDIGQYLYCSCLLTRLWCHRLWNSPYLSNQVIFPMWSKKSSQKFKYL